MHVAHTITHTRTFLLSSCYPFYRLLNTHTHTHKTHTFYPSLFLAHTHTHTHTHTNTHTLSLSRSLSTVHPLRRICRFTVARQKSKKHHSLRPILSLSHTHTHTKRETHTHTHTHAHTRTQKSKRVDDATMYNVTSLKSRLKACRDAQSRRRRLRRRMK